MENYDGLLVISNVAAFNFLGRGRRGQSLFSKGTEHGTTCSGSLELGYSCPVLFQIPKAPRHSTLPWHGVSSPRISVILAINQLGQVDGEIALAGKVVRLKRCQRAYVAGWLAAR